MNEGKGGLLLVKRTSLQSSPQGGFLIVYHLENLRALSHENIPPTWLWGCTVISLIVHHARYTMRWCSVNDPLSPVTQSQACFSCGASRAKEAFDVHWHDQEICDHRFHFRFLVSGFTNDRSVIFFLVIQQNFTERYHLFMFMYFLRSKLVWLLEQKGLWEHLQEFVS